MSAGIRLSPTPHRAAEAAALARSGERVGVSGVLDDLDRSGRAVRVPAPAASWGFRWDRPDAFSRRWWPQGGTTSADAAAAGGRLPAGPAAGRSLVVTSAYSKQVDGVSHGARLTFVDVSDPGRLRYRHVLLVEPRLREDGGLDVRPVRLLAEGSCGTRTTCW
jgi:hypothetical protein